MSLSAVTLEELLADFDLTAAKWKEFFAANPAAAEVPTDIARSGTIGALVWHIYAASVRLSQRLLGEPTSDFASVAAKDIAGAWEMQVFATAKLRGFLEGADDAALDEMLRFEIRTMGELTASRRKVCLHVFVHAMRHWAQIGPLVRQNGFPVAWPQDILLSAAIR